MSIDPYQRCPCGSGKKIKFCCRDIAADLQKVQRMIEGEQRLAAVERIDKLLEKHPNRPALLGLKSVAEIQMGRWDKAEETARQLCEYATESPLGPAQSAILRIREGNVDEAVELLQQAIVRVEQELPQQLYDAYRLVAQALFMRGEYMSAQAHLEFLLNATDEEDADLIDLMLRTTSDNRIPLLLKEELRIDNCPEGVSWEREYRHAIQPAVERGEWLKSLKRVEEMCQRVLDEPFIMRAAATLNARLARRPQAGKWFRSAARIRGTDLDDAAFDEALAQLLDPRQRDMLDVVTLTFEVPDVEQLVERLLTNKQLLNQPRSRPNWMDEDAAPPRNTFTLLDREAADSGEDLTVDTVPNLMGEVLVFGKETDREARVVLEVIRTPDFDATVDMLRNAMGNTVTTEPEQETIATIPELHFNMASRWHFPSGTSPKVRRRLLDEQRRQSILEKWPNQKLPELDGATPTEVAGQAAYKVPLLAAILNMEQSADQSGWTTDFNELRTKLSLPVPGTIDPSMVDLDTIPLHRLRRLDVEKLSDEHLAALYRESIITAANSSVRRFCNEILRRPSMDTKVDKADVHRSLAELAGTIQESIEHIQSARDIAVGRGDSPATWLIAELSMRFLQGDGETAGRLLQEIQSRYINEPGVAQSLVETLARFGLVNPDGTPRQESNVRLQPAGAASAAPPADAAGGGLWTPDSASSEPASAEPEKEQSKLWIPGMD